MLTRMTVYLDKGMTGDSIYFIFMCIYFICIIICRVHQISPVTQLLRRRWNMKSIMTDGGQIDYINLEKDLVTLYLVGKPIISDASSVRMKYQFRTTSQNPIK